MEDLVAAEALGDIASARADLARGGQAVNDYDPDEVRHHENLSGLPVCCCQVRLHAVSWHSKCPTHLCPQPCGGACQPYPSSGIPKVCVFFKNPGSVLVLGAGVAPIQMWPNA